MYARLIFFLFVFRCLPCSGAEPLPGTQPLTEEGDLAAKMVQGIHRFLEREPGVVTKAREALWKLDASSPEAWEKSIEQKRTRLRQLLGMVDARSKPEMHLQTPGLSVNDLFADGGKREIAARMQTGTVIARVEWPVFRALKAEGLLTDPATDKTAFIVIPDCGFTAEQSFGMEKGLPPETQWANRLAGIGHPVLATTLASRRAGPLMPGGRQPMYSQREVLWRAGFEMGRTLVGYEVQKVLAAVDWLCAGDPKRKIGIIGTGDGGLIALLAAALDPRIESAGLEGAFGPMEEQWREPIDRTVFGLLKEFGAAELLTMISPRSATIRNAGWHPVNYTDQGGGAPGGIREFTKQEIDGEVARSAAIRVLPNRREIVREERPEQFLLYTLAPFVWYETNIPWALPSAVNEVKPPDGDARQARLFNEVLEDTQTLMRQAQQRRGEYWKDANFSSVENFAQSAKAYRERFWTDITGKLPPATLPPNAKSRQIYETDKFTGWEVMLDVYPDVFSLGTLLLPKDLKPGEKRAVVVCQHGLEGRPSDVTDPKVDSPYYHQFGAKLAEKGYIVFAPQNPYIGKTEFRQICRKAWPLGLSLWSFIVRQHEVILTWLKTQPNVDAGRIAFYGLSYGGKSAMRLPALLPDYCLSICSADFNEWIWKNVDATAPYCYLYTGEYDMVEWNMGNTFNYAELSWLIFPRPFMVERGHGDTVGCDEWVAYEFSRSFRLYNRLGLGEKAQIEFFNGPHTINGQGTFRFLDRWLAK